jgi:hypothetical protein
MEFQWKSDINLQTYQNRKHDCHIDMISQYGMVCDTIFAPILRNIH